MPNEWCFSKACHRLTSRLSALHAALRRSGSDCRDEPIVFTRAHTSWVEDRCSTVGSAARALRAPLASLNHQHRIAYSSQRGILYSSSPTRSSLRTWGCSCSTATLRLTARWTGAWVDAEHQAARAKDWISRPLALSFCTSLCEVAHISGNASSGSGAVGHRRHVAHDRRLGLQSASLVLACGISKCICI